MGNNLSGLSPRAVWEQFEAITRVPRPSKKEERIVAWLVDFAVKHGLAYRKDAIGNVVICKPATAGMENRPTVVLQNHVDMVCEKNSDALNAAGEPFDFERDAIRPFVTEEGWVKAHGTTLGADNGIGMAMALALLLDADAAHGPLEALFTVDEETGLTGAFELGEGAITGTASGSGDAQTSGAMITGKYLINLDSEDEGEVFIGCAGGVDTLAYFDFAREAAPASGFSFFEIKVSGLKGGHSGDDIDKGRGNSNRILARALSVGLRDFGLRLAAIDGGNLRNAIPREACAVVAVPQDSAADFASFVEKFADDVRAELAYSDAGVVVALKPAAAASNLSGAATEKSPAEVIDTYSVRRLVGALLGVRCGVQAMSFAMPGLVETSTNLASVKMSPGSATASGQIVVTTSQRSSVESAKKAVAEAVGAVFELAGARVEHSEGYPGWAPNPGSHLLKVTEKAYEKLFAKPVKVRAIHAGLECGLFLERFPEMDMISTGPTIREVHSPDEKIEIATVEKSWLLLLEILRTL
ncbi:MAG: aminoacyl-histidine dipeptidase [Alistipes sp.]|jgi:dipeptidase D|nr:aminoacyl-histidine dipeptidase [Alistipes sp.]